MDSRHSTQNSTKSETSEPALLFPTDILVILNFYEHERFGVDGWEVFLGDASSLTFHFVEQKSPQN